jgi:hypothetical protein
MAEILGQPRWDRFLAGRRQGPGRLLGGFSGYFAGPDGFLWEVAWIGFFNIDASGAIERPQ